MGSMGTLVTLAGSALLAWYIFYGLVRVESDIDEADKVIWMYARRKYVRGLSAVGEFLGMGKQLALAREISAMSLFSSKSEADWEGVKVEDAVFDGVPVRVYQPIRFSSGGPALVWIHGEGWVWGSAPADDFLMAELCRRLGILIVSIDYRMAPEHPYPVPLEDCERATLHFMENAANWGVDKGRISVGGASAGGNLAAALALKLRDSKKPYSFRMQILIVPCLQAFDFNTPAYQENEHNTYLPKYWMINYWLWYGFGWESLHYADKFATNEHTSTEAKKSDYGKYLSHDVMPNKFLGSFYKHNKMNIGDDQTWSEVKSVITDPYFAPLMAKDLKGLPKAYVVTARYDVLRDDGVMYAKRLESAGVDVEWKHYDKAFHEVYHPFRSLAYAQSALDDLVEYLKQQL